MAAEASSGGGGKILESLRRLLLELSESQSGAKQRTSQQICSSLTELTNNVMNKSLSPQTNPQLISSAIELLVHAYGNVDQDIRLAASENLRKLIKALMGTQLYRLQQGLFHELKKNGPARSLCLALECFSSLYSRTRPQKCHNLSQQLYPVLLRIIARPEEVVHENLIESLAKILPTMTPFLNSTQVQSIMTELLQHLHKSSASFRRMMAATFTLLCIHSKIPEKRANWIIDKLIILGSSPKSSQHDIQGVLLSLLNLLQHANKLKPSSAVLKQIYSLSLSAMKYGDHNTLNVALEVLENLFLSATPEFCFFLTTPLTPPIIAQNIWSLDTFDTLSLDEKSDTESQLDAPCDSYFENSEEVNTSTTQAQPTTTIPSSAQVQLSGRVSPSSSLDSWSVASAQTEVGYLTGTSNVPLQDLVEYTHQRILSHSRVSVKSVGLSVVAAAVTLYPKCLTELTDLESFLDSEDPKLVSRMSNLLAQLIATEVRSNGGRFELCRPIVGVACRKIADILGSESPVVLKAACESLRVCLLPLLGSSHPNKAIELLEKLITLTDINYWLLKVELLQTLAVVDYAQLAVVKHSLLLKVLEDVTIPLLSDSDYRVRSAVSATLTQLAKSLDHTPNHLLSLGRQHAKLSYGHLHISTMQLSLAGIGRTDSKTVPTVPSCLEHIVWQCTVFLGASANHWGQRGALEALCTLTEEYPPPTLPTMWGVNGSDCGLLEMILQLLRGSWLSWQVQTHNQLLQLATSLFLACALDSLHQAASEGRVWEGGTERAGVVRHSTTLLLHVLKILNIFQHVIDNRDPEEKEVRNIVKKIETTLSPKGKSNQSDFTPAPPIKEAIGNIVGLPHYLKLYDALNSAYTNYKVSIDQSVDDKFSSFLSQVHQCLAGVFEVSLAEEVGRHVEEIISYLSVTITVDASGALLCLQQLLNALFGMNVATQQTHLYSPFLSSLPYTLEAPPTTTPTNSLVECLVVHPLKQMNICLHAPPPTTPIAPADEQVHTKKRRSRLWLFGAKRTLVLKPLNALSSIKDYLVYFEPLIVSSMRLFGHTSSLLIQERVLFMMVQLLHLKVRYDLLDCNKFFLDSVNRILNLMETGNVKGGAQLVPHLFQFLVLLANDSSKLVSIPEVMQKCDAVMASGSNVTSFAIPALQPLVLYLFVRPTTTESFELNTQREVVLNMLLRLVEYPPIIKLLIFVLECYQGNASDWFNTSSLIFAALLAPIGRLQTVLDTPNSLSSLHQLFATMTPSSISAQGLILALTKQKKLTSPRLLTRWLAVLSTILRLMATVFPEETLLAELKDTKLTTPTLDCVGVAAPLIQWPTDTTKENGSVKMMRFLLESLTLGISCLCQLLQVPQDILIYDVYDMLPMVLSDILLLLELLITSDYKLLCSEFAKVSPPSQLLTGLVGVSHICPVLPLHFTSLLVKCGGDGMKEWMKNVLNSLQEPLTPTQQLLLQCLILLPQSGEGWVESISPTHLLQHLTCHEGVELIEKSNQIEAFHANLLSVLPSLPHTTTTECIKLMTVIKCIGGDVGMGVVKMVTEKFVTHPVKAVSQEATLLLEKLLVSCQLSTDDAKEIMTIAPKIENSCGSLWKTLLSHVTTDHTPQLDVTSCDPLSANIVLDIAAINKEWQMNLIIEASSSCTFPIQVLAQLNQSEINYILNHANFSSAHLERCIVYGIFQTLAKRNVLRSVDNYSNVPILTPPIQSENLFLLSIAHLEKLIRKYLEVDEDNYRDLPYLIRSLVWFLIGRSQILLEIELDNQFISDMVEFSRKVLERECNQLPHHDIIVVESVLDCCSLILQTIETISMVTDEWIQSVTGLVVKIVEHEYATEYEAEMENDDSSLACHQLNWVISCLLSSSTDCSQHALQALAFTLARQPLFSPAIFLPPLLTTIGEGVVTTQLLDKSLADSDILQEYMQRSNLIGWKTRSQFEERWMQLLGVLNALFLSNEMPREELVARNIGLCSGVRATTSLLMSTVLRPHPGSPSSSIPMHTHRNKDFNFLSSPPGKKLLPHRALIQSQVLLHCALRSHRHAHYQLPIMSDSQSITCPPVYSQNLERSLGSTSVTPCQLSYASLVPIILKTDLSKGGGSPVSIAEIDTRSCIMSLIDLYTHWLSQPIDLLLLHHTLTSIIMLSDLFILSSQFEWMLETFLSLTKVHPQEDTLTEALLVLGTLKSAAVLRVKEIEAEEVAKLVEQSLTQDAFITTQNACLEGLLYVVEDNESTILTLVGPFVAKYIHSQMTSYQSYSEHHLMLVWALATHLVLLQTHGQPTKDPLFTSQLLELVVPILSDTLISSQFCQSLMLGLEYMVLSFSLSSKERCSLTHVAASRFVQSDHSKSLSALALLLTCMYTGEEADRLSGLSGPQDDMAALSETVYQSREHISNILERLRQGNETEVEFLVHLLPGLIVDFLPRMDGMNMVVSEVISQQQSRPWLAALVMAKTFELFLMIEIDPTIPNKTGPTVLDWVLLSLDSFIQQEPESHAVWFVTCLFIAASTNPILRTVIPIVTQKYLSIDLEWLLKILCMAAHNFFHQQNFPDDQRKTFLDKFDKSSYSSLQKVASSLRK